MLVAKGGEAYHHKRVTWLGGSLFYPRQLFASRVNSSTRFLWKYVKSWLAHGRRVTLLPRTNFLHFKVTSFGRGKVPGGKSDLQNFVSTSIYHTKRAYVTHIRRFSGEKAPIPTKCVREILYLILTGNSLQFCGRSRRGILPVWA